jgi:hypothetical protein
MREHWIILELAIIGVALGLTLGGEYFYSKRPTHAERSEPRISWTPAEISNLRTQCLSLVDKLVDAQDIGRVRKNLSSTVVARFNPRLDRCYAVVTVIKNPNEQSDVPNNYRVVAVHDAQTGELLVVSSQEGGRSYGIFESGQNESFTTREKADAEIARLTKED